MSSNTANLLYLITIVTFILALRFLSNPAHARRGNQIGALGMLLAVIVTGAHHPGLFMQIVAFVAVVLATANVVGGFVVTDRMLEMFKKREAPKEPEAPGDGKSGE